MFHALLEEAISSTRPRSFPERFATAKADDVNAIVRANRTAETQTMRARERVLSSRPRSPSARPRETACRPTRVISGEGPIAAPRPKSPEAQVSSEQAACRLSRQEVLETAREAAREQAAARHYALSRQLVAEAKALSQLAAQLSMPTALPMAWDDGPFAEEAVRGWPRR